MRNIIYFDIDYTLINTDLLRNNIESKNRKVLQLDKESYSVIEKKYLSTLASSTDFRPDNYIKYLSEHVVFNKDHLYNNFNKNRKDYENSVYPETKFVLDRLYDKFSMGIFSEGSLKFQLTKLELSGLLSYFDKNLIHIFRRKLEPQAVNKLDPNSLVVDDNINVINTLAEHSRLKPIWITRSEKNVINIPSITTLKGVLKYLD